MMVQRQKCCAHCPGIPVATLSRKEHFCQVPTYVGGNLRVSSLQKTIPGEEERAIRLQRKPAIERRESRNNPQSMFSIAKKFHAENLQHQPLPDRVDDAIFMNTSPCKCDCIRRNVIERCQKIVPRPTLEPPKKPPEKQYGPVLGCKKPESNMDLAICWETPLDPVYEPRKPTHVDGSNGGAAPAVFTLVQHKRSHSCGCINRVSAASRSESRLVDNELPQQPVECYRSFHANKNGEEVAHRKEDKGVDTKENEEGNPNNDLCKDLDSLYISKHVCGKGQPKPSSACNERRSKYSRQLRHCTACVEKNNRNGGMNKRNNSANYCLPRYRPKDNYWNGLPDKRALVPRPRTPFARRSFCIDTLAPPFSIMNGSRDSDYPEHWRLTSVYQQSYRNPRRYRSTILNYNF